MRVGSLVGVACGQGFRSAVVLGMTGKMPVATKSFSFSVIAFENRYNTRTHFPLTAHLILPEWNSVARACSRHEPPCARVVLKFLQQKMVRKSANSKIRSPNFRIPMAAQTAIR